ncbi:hypothetical protein WJX81_006702 [Elliptochloris bilobata]|uniref:Fatty acid desaturase domain-containing protein n=1 Tax=Elliptochloris bilobata TaxID=381761 RepID=A0AAW1R363_9CHLO
MLNDSRDAPNAFLLYNLLIAAVPAASALFLLPPSHWLGVAYFATLYALFLARFLVAVLHVTEHRRLFKPGYELLNYIAPYLLAPLFGVPSGLYTLHHVIMHHTEDNHAPHDLSSTEAFQRDNPLHFLLYWLRHAVGGLVEVPLYAVRRRGWALAGRCVASEAAYLGAVAALWRARPTATLWALVVPYFVTSLALMFGNWSQHIFVRSGGRSGDSLAYTCVGDPGNALTCNDGYHVTHHENSRLHWSELPQRFLESLPVHDRACGIAFKGIGVFEVGVACFAGRLNWLAERWVPCGPATAALTRAEKVALLRQRLAPVPSSGRWHG